MVVLEKGSYVRAQDLAGLEKDGYDTMYERAGLMMGTDDNGELPYLVQKHAGANLLEWNLRSQRHSKGAVPEWPIARLLGRPFHDGWLKKLGWLDAVVLAAGLSYIYFTASGWSLCWPLPYGKLAPVHQASRPTEQGSQYFDVLHQHRPADMLASPIWLINPSA